MVAQLRQFGVARRGWIGVRIQQVTAEIAEGLGLPTTPGRAGRRCDARAGRRRKAGLVNGDLVTGFDGKPVSDDRALPRIVADTPIGKTVNIDVLRKGTQADLAASRSPSWPKTPSRTSRCKAPPPAPKNQSKLSQLGLSLGVLDAPRAAKFKIGGDVQGVVVTDVDPGQPGGGKEFACPAT